MSKKTAAVTKSDLQALLSLKTFPANFARALALAEGSFEDGAWKFKAQASDALSIPVASINRWLRIGELLVKNPGIYESVKDKPGLGRILTTVSVSGLSMSTILSHLREKGIIVHDPSGINAVERLKQEVKEFGGGFTLSPLFSKSAEKGKEKPSSLSFFQGVLPQTHGNSFTMPLSPLCFALGLDIKTQARKIQNSFWGQNKIFQSADGHPANVGIDVRIFPMWIATIDPTEVLDKDVLANYQTRGVNAVFESFQVTTATPIDSRLDYIDAVLTQLQDKISQLNSVKMPAASGNFSILRTSENPGKSATRLFEEFNERHGESFNIHHIRNIAAGLGIIDDPKLGGWFAHSTEAHGQTRKKHWRFNQEGQQRMIIFLEYYMSQAAVLVEDGTCRKRDEVLQHLLGKYPKVGTGTFEFLTKEFPIDPTNSLATN